MKKNKGFTLIELMIVIVIAIAIIVVSVVVSGVRKFNRSEDQYSANPVKEMKVEDNPDVTNCTALQDDDRVIYSCPDGKIYTKKNGV